MKYFFLAILVLFELGRLSAQSFVGNLNPYPATVERKYSVNETLKILAIMVNFQEDADGTTAGNGKFGTIYTQNYGSDILDPLPHDKKYFEAHLEFVKNYFAKVSKNQLNVEYTVLPDTFSVSQRMRNYSPAPRSNDFTPIANFSVEAWTKADQLYPGYPFSDYDVFLIFHAGVGRDISLPGSIGNERDLPSVYLSDKAFKEIYGNEYEGIPVSGGSFKITNSMIIPETESREVETISGKFLFQITINGLLCASVGSHLGLPDLFNTETGLSAIGRFGLMDGQSIFAYLGVFPPEPAPWEKIHLRWVEPVTLQIQNADVSIVTNLAATMSDTVILKIPLNSSEYYLIENRIRDANKDGSTLSYIQGDVVKTKTFLNDTTGYRSFDVDSLSGVIIDVDEFDWAVPGNGIVIWHIDENVINEKIAENKVNTDKNRRGVDVEEADGVQDIGEVFYTIFGDQLVGEGTEEDFWHKDNPATLFKNLFAKDTRPNTLTNTGANSLITVKDFSEIDNRMSFRVEFGDSVVKPLFTIPVLGASDGIFALSTIKFDDNILFLTRNGSGHLTLLDKDSVYLQIDFFTAAKQSVLNLHGNLHIYGGNSNKINYLVSNGQIAYQGFVNVPYEVSSPVVINYKENLKAEIWFGTSKGIIYKYSLAALPGINPLPLDSILLHSNVYPFQLSINDDFYAVICSPISGQNPADLTLFFSSLGNVSLDGEYPLYLATTKDSKGNYISVVKTERNNFFIIQDGKVINRFSVDPSSSPIFSLTDLKRDGNIYILNNTADKIEAYNLNGSLADNFSVNVGALYGLAVAPLSADIEGDNNPEVFSVTWNGDIYALDGGTGKLINGFPVSTGGSSIAQSLFVDNNKVNIVAGTLGKLYAWSISSVEGKLYWSEEYGNPQNTSFIDAAENTNRINEFFPANRAYNYPNPVYEGTTNIRYYVAEDSKINIKIFDLAGDFVAELNDDAQGGMDNETVWNVGDIQSGVYLARIEAVCDCGKTEQAIIKIAIVK